MKLALIRKMYRCCACSARFETDVGSRIGCPACGHPYYREEAPGSSVAAPRQTPSPVQGDWKKRIRTR